MQSIGSLEAVEGNLVLSMGSLQAVSSSLEYSMGSLVQTIAVYGCLV